jgi:hypothetical protein
MNGLDDTLQILLRLLASHGTQKEEEEIRHTMVQTLKLLALAQRVPEASTFDTDYWGGNPGIASVGISFRRIPAQE